MRSFYEQDGIVIFNADASEVMADLRTGEVDSVITDPPYVGLTGGMSNTSSGGGNDLSPLRECGRVAKLGAICFCSWHDLSIRELLGGSVIGLLTWYKRNAPQPVRNRPHYTTEFAWMIEYSPGIHWRKVPTMIDIPTLAGGCMATERIVKDGKTAHPTQKPLDLMSRIVPHCGSSILDPYCGTGTTLIAAKLAGMRAIGIEINEAYCEIAAQRLRQGVLFGERV